MPKGRRINIPDGIYHVMTRGNRKGSIFEDDRDRVRFIEIVADSAERHDVRVFAECRMGNHYHQVVQTPRANLPKYMGLVNGWFTQYSNHRHRRIGHLFAGPYLPLLVDHGSYLRAVTGYVALNPVNDGFADSAADWRWSSYRATAGLEEAPSYLSLDWLDAVFPSANREEAQKRYREYLTPSSRVMGDGWNGRPAVGSAPFERDIREHIGTMLFMARVPGAYRSLRRPPLDELLTGHTSLDDRNTAMLRAHVMYAYSESEIARCVAMHPASVSRIIARLRRAARKCDKG
jgi:putative transposase